jgi:sugar phosphate permease
VPPTVKLSTKAFGRDQGPLIFGWVFAAHQMGAATAALTAGISRDVLSSYLPAFYAAGVMCLVAAIAVLFARVRQPVTPLLVAGE